MIIQTKNTRYVLEDRGDGAFLVSGNPKYFDKPYMMRLLREPRIGDSLWMQYIDDMPDSVRAKNHRVPGVITSLVVSIEHP